MPQAEIRLIHIDDMLKHYAPLQRYAFFASPPMDVSSYEERRILYEACHILGMFEGDRALATAMTVPMSQNVRGKVFQMGGVAGVTSDPTTRRKGYVRQLMVQLFHDMHEDSVPVSMLYPFRESFYERLGYTTFPHIKSIRLKTADMKPLLNMELSGFVEYDNQKIAWDEVGRDFLKEVQSRTHGMGLFIDSSLNFLYGDDSLWFAIARDDEGEVIGTMAYKIVGFRGTFEIQRFFAKNTLGRYLLLQFIAKHIDQTPEVHFQRLPAYERPETWLSDFNVKAEPDIWLTPLGRIINVRELGGMQVGAGKLTVEVEDEFCDWNNGVFTFESYKGELVVSEGGEAECKITINALSALIYGTHDPRDFQFRGWGNPSEATIQKMLALFPLELPYLLCVF